VQYAERRWEGSWAILTMPRKARLLALQIYAENRNRYNRAYAACMEGKNYTVR
jgi:hypothetical protein